MSSPDKKVTDKDITYRVGWKKGKIHVQEPGVPGHPESPDAISSQPAATRDKLFRIIWKAVPSPTDKAAAICAGVLPIAAFAAVVWLVSRLSQG